MKTFKDNNGRDWTVAINVDSIKRVRAMKQVDLLSVVEGPLLEKLHTDFILLVDVLFCVCKPQADERGITDEQFGQALFGDPIGDAQAALLEGIELFFPSHSRERKTVRAAVEKFRQLAEAAGTVATKEIEGIDVNAQLAQAIGGNTSTSLPESSASIPVPTPPAS